MIQQAINGFPISMHHIEYPVWKAGFCQQFCKL